MTMSVEIQYRQTDRADRAGPLHSLLLYHLPADLGDQLEVSGSITTVWPILSPSKQMRTSSHHWSSKSPISSMLKLSIKRPRPCWRDPPSPEQCQP